MKKTLNMMLAMMAGAMAFTACSNDDILENIENNEVVENASQLKPMTFTAVQEGQGGTRTAIATDTDGKANGINWTAGDKISIFDGSNAYGGDQMFTIENGAGTTSATFTGSAASASTYYALYPYAVGTSSESRTPTQAEAETAAGSASGNLDSWKNYIEIDEYMVQSDMDYYEISTENQAIILAYLKNQPTTIVTPGVALEGSNIKNVVIPAEQTATAGSADPKAMVMVAQGNDKDALEFKNVCAYVKVIPQFNCYAIALISKGAQNLAGTVTVNYNEGEPTTTVTADGTNSVSLVGSITAGNAYYIAVRPESLASGFTIEFLTAGDKKYYARSTNNALALARSNVKNLGEFTTSGTWTYKDITTHGTDNGHDWVLLSPGGIKIATTKATTSNVKYANIPTNWGDGWVLPSVEDFQSIYNNGFYVASKAITLKGKGILKYVANVEITRSNSYFWTSTPDASDPTNKIMRINLNRNGNAEAVDKNSTLISQVLFKYTK